MISVRRAAIAALIVAAAAASATALLWPGGVIEPAAVVLGDYFSAAELARWDDFRGPQRLLGLAGAVVWLLAVAAVLLLSPFYRIRRAASGAALTGGLAIAAGSAAALPIRWVAATRAQDAGLMTQSQAAWLSDGLLIALIAALIAASLMAGLTLLLRLLPRLWWAGAAALIVAAAAVLTLVSPVVIEPLFAEFREPRNSAIERDAKSLAARAGVTPEKLFVIDASKRTGGVNAYVSGWGPTERIVFYDTLLARFSRAQARGVLAHEIAHAKHGDVPRGLLWLALFAFPSAFAVSLVVKIEGRGKDRFVAAPTAAVALLAVAAFGSVAASPLSRQVEARADSTALRLTDDPRAARALTLQLARQNFGDPEPPALHHLLFGSHPTIKQRLGSIESFSRRRRPPVSGAPGR